LSSQNHYLKISELIKASVLGARLNQFRATGLTSWRLALFSW